MKSYFTASDEGYAALLISILTNRDCEEAFKICREGRENHSWKREEFLWILKQRESGSSWVMISRELGVAPNACSMATKRFLESERKRGVSHGKVYDETQV